MTPDELAAYQADQRVKLLRARHAIEAILKEHDLVGSVVLGGLFGQFETLTPLDATWSNLSIETKPGVIGIRCRSLVKDNPDKFTRQRNLESSVAVLNAFGEMMTSIGLMFLASAEQVNEATNAKNGPLEPAHTKQ